MQKMVLAAVGIPIAAALGLGCYEMGKQSKQAGTPTANESSFVVPAPGSPQSLTESTRANEVGNTTSNNGMASGGATSSARTGVTASQLTPPAAYQPGGVQGISRTQVLPGNQVVTKSPPARIYDGAPATSYGAAPGVMPSGQPVTLYSQQPVAATPPVVADRTEVEKETVVARPRTVYRKVYISKKHKSGKVHIARATKHGAMFALKLPGRLAL